jgi:tetratricopeptide (TPR) repeat protein
MKRNLSLFVSLLFICSSSFVPAQTGEPQKPFSRAFDLVQQGQLELAVSVLKVEVETPERTVAQRGRAYSLLAYAYKEQGNFPLAQKSFDRALRLMDEAGDHSNDYAATLDFYSGMLMSTGDLDAAHKALGEAAAVYSRLANHAGLVKIYTHTAELEIERKKYKRAKAALASARAEAQFANQSDSGMDSEIDATSGWLAISTGNFHEGAVAYSAALEKCRQQLGENNSVTGWSYLLLGKSEELDHNLAGAESNMEKGLAILKQTVGTNNIRYLAGELAYSELLDQSGSHAEAVRISSAANQSMKSLGLQQCAACTVSVWSLRHEGGQ